MSCAEQMMSELALMASKWQVNVETLAFDPQNIAFKYMSEHMEPN